MIWILFFLLLLLAAYWFFPKGNPVHEGLHLLDFWVPIWRSSVKDLPVEKISYGLHRQQYFLWIPPPDPGACRLFVLYFHGGGWQFARPKGFRAQAKVLRAQGYGVILASYRKIPFHHAGHLREDLDLLIVRVERRLEETGQASLPLVVGGMSAGGHLAAWLFCQQEELRRLGIRPSRLAGLFAFGAPLDLAAMPWSPPLFLLAGRRDSERFRKANPVTHLKYPDDRPVLLFHGTKDGLVPYRVAVSFFEKLKPLNPNAQLITLRGQTHIQTAGWSHGNEEVRRRLLEWLEKKVAKVAKVAKGERGTDQ